MDKANYTENGKGRYPLSTEGLEFIQQQIALVYSVAELHGRNYILKNSTTSANGIIVVDGEMMPLKGSPNAYIQVVEEYDTLEADGMVFEKARVRRHAEYVGVQTGKGCYEASHFQTLTTIEAMTPHLMPKGAIVMWSGATTAIPNGWALCDGTNKTPDLRGRFIVGYDKNDADYNVIGNTGGYKKFTLPANQSGLPNTLVSNITIKKGKAYSGTSASQHDCVTDITISKENSHNANSDHENRPPYYVLAYIMKII